MNDWFSSGKTLVIAHRGASAAAPENTLAAFALAAELGADGVELDVQLTADGQLVIFHDDTVTRMTGQPGRVTQMTLAQLKSLDLGAGQTVPTLDELFEMLGPALLYNIEIKDFRLRDYGIETAVADRVEAHNLQARTLISSFNPLCVRRARRVFSRQVPVALLREPGWLQYTYLLASGEADHPAHSLVTADYMAWARQRGYRVNTWTVDEPAEARRLAELGVDGIISNRPDAIRQALWAP